MAVFSAVLLPYTHRSAANLEREGIERHRIFVTGNPIFEVLQHYHGAIDSSPALTKHELEPKRYLLATCHRAENVDRPEVLAGLRDALVRVAALYEMPLVLSVHPRLQAVLGDTTFEGTRVVPLPAMPGISGVVLADHVKCLDWRARRAEYAGVVPEAVVAEVVRRLGMLLGSAGSEA